MPLMRMTVVWESQNSNQTNPSLELNGNEKYFGTLWDENDKPLMRMTVAYQQYENLKILTQLTRVWIEIVRQ